VRCDADQNTSWDGLRFEVLHPLALHDQAGLNPNDLSCVLRIRAAAGQRALLTSDLEA
jgi:competence protein ComEC